MMWDQLTSPRLASVPKHTPVVLPIAATEQHGPHLPLATDRLIAEHFARRLHEILDDAVLVLPAIAVGCSEHHMDFAGSLSLTHMAFIQLVTEILESVAAHGFENLVLLNAHGGNLGSGQVVLESFGRRHPQCRVVMITWWVLAADKLMQITETGPGGIGHACEFETSLMLHIAPELVNRDAIAGGGNQPTFAWAEGDMLRKSRATLYRSSKQMSSSGVFGDPRAASAEKGMLIEETVLAEMIPIIQSLS